LLPVVDRLRARFSIGRVCVVADRGMISAATIEGLEQRKLEYILGARERTDAIARKIVLENDDPFVPLLIERETGKTQLFIKQVKIEGRRYIVCRNEAEAEKDRADRQAILAGLARQLDKRDKALRTPAKLTTSFTGLRTRADRVVPLGMKRVACEV
jgi:transposase